MDAPTRFFRKVEKTETCWNWKGSGSSDGYGFFYDGKFFMAHRWSYVHHKGPIPQGLYICHTCDRPPCVNPDHLFIGTATDNHLDAVAKGHCKPKLDPEKVTEIRFLRGLGVPMPRLAEMYGVGSNTIENCVKRLSWKWVA